MKYGLVLPNVGSYSDPRLVADISKQAEDAGWDGVFLWDSMLVSSGTPTNDPWIALAAIAMQTERIKIGLQVAVPPRRRPWKMAREAVTLDHLSNGRFILGVGSGDSEGDKGIGAFGDEIDLKKRAEMLDESLAILQGLWSGEPFRYDGKYYHIDDITFLPTPVQKPGIPIWVGWMGRRKKPMERAARFDGASPVGYALNPVEVRELKHFIGERHPEGSPFDIAIQGNVFEAIHNEQVQALLRANEEAGATWVLQSIWAHNRVNTVRSQIQQGPPSLQ